MAKASSLAAAIKSKFGIEVKLIEGHNGIYEVKRNGEVISSNQNPCSKNLIDDEIYREIQKHANPICGCGGTEMKPISLDDHQDNQRHVDIEFMYLDLSVCTWCQSTETNLDEAISEVAQVLKATGVEVNVKKIHIQSEEQARNLGFISSPTIRINGRDIQLEVKEALCDSCGDLCGDTVDCRIWTYRGKKFTAPPKGMIIDSILREVYGGIKNNIASPVKGEVPENLKKFFAAKQRKEHGSSKATACCTPSGESGSC